MADISASEVLLAERKVLTSYSYKGNIPLKHHFVCGMQRYFPLFFVSLLVESFE